MGGRRCAAGLERRTTPLPWRLLGALAGLALAASGCDDDSGVETDGGPTERLVTTAWLQEHLADEDLVVVDARATNAYLEEHIPGAVSASFDEASASSRGVYTSYGGGVDLFVDVDNPIPFQDDPERVAQAVAGMGITPDSTVVVYDAGVDFGAARFFWTLHYYGFDDVRVLDGGLRKWTADGYETSTEIPQVAPGSFEPRVRDPDLSATTDYVLGNLTNPDVKVITSLGPEWHYGISLPYSETGHIPYAIQIPMSYLFRADGTWTSTSTQTLPLRSCAPCERV
ncbi:MAG: sulfurtransferase [Myxococcota bacterium]